MRKLFIFVPVIFALLVGGCVATKSGMKEKPEGVGVSKTFNYGYKEVSKAARVAIVNSGLAIEESSQPSPGKLVLIAKKDGGRFSYGELVRVTVKKASEQQTLVEIYTKRRLSLNVVAKGDWSDTIFSNIELELN